MEKRENFSRKRMAIYETLCSTDTHPTAEWVYTQLKPQYKDLSLGTVYRNLKRFCETGKTVSVGVVNGQERFDAKTFPHSHFVCEVCGCVEDIPESFFDRGELAAISEKYGKDVTQAEVMFKGVCKNCR